jgi:hypothetical protein
MPEEENSGKPFTRSTHRQGHGVPAYRLEYLNSVTQNYDVHPSVTTVGCVLTLAATCSRKILKLNSRLNNLPLFKLVKTPDWSVGYSSFS